MTMPAADTQTPVTLIALCGYPEAGKTTVQEILARRYGAVSIDDGGPLREAAKTLFGLSDWHVSTQDGKRSNFLPRVPDGPEGEARVTRAVACLYGISLEHASAPCAAIEVGERTCTTTELRQDLGLWLAGRTEVMTVRRFLGDLGAYLEAVDPLHLPKLAIRQSRAAHPDRVLSFGSVRRDQGRAYKAAGGAMVVEIWRDGCKPSAPFDEYEADLCDVRVVNAFEPADPEGSKARLEAAVIAVLDGPVLGRSAA